MPRLPNDNRYGALRPSASEPAPCQVSQCLVFAAAKAVEDLGEIKDKAEAEVNIADADDVVPKRLRAPAEAIYHEIRQSDLIKTYVDQLKSCKDAQ